MTAKRARPYEYFMKLLCMALAMVAALFVSTFNASAQETARTDWTLMREYGAILRQSYRTGNEAPLRSQRYLSLEHELEQRGLIDRGKLIQIRQGIFYLGMPVSQAMASVDNFHQVDYLSLPGAEIYTFVGDPPEGGFARRTREARSRGFTNIVSRVDFDHTFVVSCNDRVMKMQLPNGLITQDTYSEVFGSGRIHFQTNFPSGFWAEENYAARTRGRQVFDYAETHGDNFDHFLWFGFGAQRDKILPSVYWERGRRNPNNLFQQRLDSRMPIC